MKIKHHFGTLLELTKPRINSTPMLDLKDSVNKQKFLKKNINKNQILKQLEKVMMDAIRLGLGTEAILIQNLIDSIKGDAKLTDRQLRKVTRLRKLNII